jgi:glycosyltransferase involved in cell wall biosynthesis
MGLVLVEAMSAGLPCVAVGKYGPGEVVIDGETGFVVPLDEGPFADAVGRLLTDQHLRRRMGSAAQRRARHFDPGLAGDAMLAVYRETRQPRTAAGSVAQAA